MRNRCSRPVTELLGGRYPVLVGFGVTRIDRIRPIAEIVPEIVREAETAILRLDRGRGATAA